MKKPESEPERRTVLIGDVPGRMRSPVELLGDCTSHSTLAVSAEPHATEAPSFALPSPPAGLNRAQRRARHKARGRRTGRRCSCCNEPRAIGWQKDNQGRWGRVCEACAAPGQPIRRHRR